MEKEKSEDGKPTREELEQMTMEDELIEAKFQAYYWSLPPKERKKALHEMPGRSTRGSKD